MIVVVMYLPPHRCGLTAGPSQPLNSQLTHPNSALPILLSWLSTVVMLTTRLKQHHYRHSWHDLWLLTPLTKLSLPTGKMGHKILALQLSIIALMIGSSCGVRRYRYGSRIRSLAPERRSYTQQKDFYSDNSILRSSYKMKNIYEQGKSKYYKYSKRFRWVKNYFEKNKNLSEFYLENQVMLFMTKCQQLQQQRQQHPLPLHQPRPPCL